VPFPTGVESNGDGATRGRIVRDPGRTIYPSGQITTCCYVPSPSTLIPSTSHPILLTREDQRPG